MSKGQDMPQGTRAATERQERRRKPGAVALTGLKLGVDESKLDRDQFEYRFVNDRGGRVQRLAAEDWDPAPEGAVLGGDEGQSVQGVIAGTAEGKPYRTVLMRKPKDWFTADKKEQQATLDEMDEAIRRGLNHQQKEPELVGSGTYTPGGTNTIQRS